MYLHVGVVEGVAAANVMAIGDLISGAQNSGYMAGSTAKTFAKRLLDRCVPTLITNSNIAL